MIGKHNTNKKLIKTSENIECLRCSVVFVHFPSKHRRMFSDYVLVCLRNCFLSLSTITLSLFLENIFVMNQTLEFSMFRDLSSMCVAFLYVFLVFASISLPKLPASFQAGSFLRPCGMIPDHTVRFFLTAN